MKRYIKVFALILAAVMVASSFVGCKEEKKEQFVGKVNGVAIPDGIFINCFFNEVDKEYAKEDWAKKYGEKKGKELYDALKETIIDGKSHFDIILENAIEEARLFMIEYVVLSGKDTWPNEEARKEIEKNTVSYIEQMNTYYGQSFGTTSVEEFVKVAFGMHYDEYLDFLTMSGCVEKYKEDLRKATVVSDDEIKEFFEANKKTYQTVQVRHSLLKLEDDADDNDKAELLKEAQELVDKYNAGEITFDDIMKESDDVDSEGKPNNDGYYTVYNGAGFVPEFEAWGVAQTEASDKIEIVESDHGYHIMMCTKVFDLTDTDLNTKVKEAYIEKAVSDAVDKDINPHKDEEKYKISSYNKAYAEKLAKRTITGEFEDEPSSTADSSAQASGTASATATPTTAPEVKDADADKTVIAKYKDNEIYKAYYSQFFSQAMNIALQDYNFSEINKLEDKSEYNKALKELFNKEYKDGKSYLEYSKGEALNLMLKFFATKDLAIEAEKGYSDEKKKELLTELDGQIDSMLMYYGESYGVDTRDELMMQLMGMKVNDYKEVYVNQMLVSDYSSEIIEDIKPTEEELRAHYEKDPDAYRVVTVRTITKSIVDKSGKALSEEELAKIEKLVNTLKTKYENGDSAEALAKGYSDTSDSYNGLIDLVKTSISLPEEIMKWAFEQTEIGAYTVIKTDTAYMMVVIEGLIYYDKAEGIAALDTTTIESVTDEVELQLKNATYDAKIDKYVKDNNLALADVNEEVVAGVIADYLSVLDTTTEEK